MTPRAFAIDSVDRLIATTTTDYRACRTCGWLFLAFATVIALPPLILSGSKLYQAWLASEILNDSVIFYLVFLGGGCTLLGATLLGMATWLRNDPEKSSYVRRLCGLALLSILLFFAGSVLWPYILWTWEWSPETLQWRQFLYRAPLRLSRMSIPLDRPQLIAVWLLWNLSMVFATMMLWKAEKVDS